MPVDLEVISTIRQRLAPLVAQLPVAGSSDRKDFLTADDNARTTNIYGVIYGVIWEKEWAKELQNDPSLQPGAAHLPLKKAEVQTRISSYTEDKIIPTLLYDKDLGIVCEYGQKEGAYSKVTHNWPKYRYARKAGTTR